jgi:TetR/AcrR family transcriptional regulator, tetracycline repressor protein
MSGRLQTTDVRCTLSAVATRQQTRGRLSRQRVLQTALAVVDRSGADALTMRSLADELGVAAMSLYNHVRGRDDLLDGLSEVLVDRIGAQPPGGEPPREALSRFAHGIRAVATAHPAAFQLVGMRPLRTRAALVPVETALAALRAWGLGGAEATNAYRALVSYARGFALAEIAGFTLESRTIRDSSHIDPAALPPAEFPTVVELAPRLSARADDAAFEFGLDALLSGLEPRRRRR